MIYKKSFSKIVSIFIAFLFTLMLVGPAYATAGSASDPAEISGSYSPSFSVHTLPSVDANPNLGWNTFLGGNNIDNGAAIAADNDGNVYVGGTSRATWGSPVRSYSSAGDDAFVAKLNPDGELVWNTFLGAGNYGDGIQSIAVDDAGNIYVSGSSSTTWGTPVRAYSASRDVFVAKLDANGNLMWSTFLGGTGLEWSAGITYDDDGNVYVSGASYLQSWGAPVKSFSSPMDIFAAKLDSNGNLVWNTFLNASTSSDFSGAGISLDNNGNIYISSSSAYTWGTPIRAHGSAGIKDVFVAKLDLNGNLSWNTFLGSTTGHDSGADIALDANNNVYVVGTSEGSEKWGTPISAYGPIFAASLDSNGSVIWNTFLGTAWSYGYAIDIDDTGNIYIGGSSMGGWGPSGKQPYPPYNGGNDDAFVAELKPNGSLLWNTFVGGINEWDCAGYGKICDIAVNGDGDIYLLGGNTSSWGSPVRAYSALDDVSIAKIINLPVITSLSHGPSPTKESTIDFTLKFSEPVTGVDAADFSLSFYDIAGASITNVTGSDDTYNVTVNTGSGDGTITLNILNDLSIQDFSGNLIKSVVYPFSSSGTIQAFKPPVVLFVVRTNPNPATSTTVNYVVTFSRPVTGVDPSDFFLTTTKLTGAFISEVKGSGTTRTIKVNTGYGDGTIRLDVVDDDTILDEASHPLNGTGIGDGDFSTGEVYSIDKPSLPSPILRSPGMNVFLNNSQPTLQWTKVPGAESYEIEFDDVDDFSSPDGNSTVGITGATYTAASPFGDGGPYFWHVRAYNNNQPGRWSSFRTFTIDTTSPAVPNLISPSGTTTRGIPTFRWQPSPSVVLYEFVYDDTSDCLSPNYFKTTRGTSIRPPTIPGGTYYWCVKAKDAAGNWSGLSTPSSFTITP